MDDYELLRELGIAVAREGVPWPFVGIGNPSLRARSQLKHRRYFRGMMAEPFGQINRISVSPRTCAILPAFCEIEPRRWDVHESRMT